MHVQSLLLDIIFVRHLTMAIKRLTIMYIVCLAVLPVLSCSENNIDYIQKTRDIEIKACACKDTECAKQALRDYKALFDELKRTSATGSTKELRQMNDSAKKIQACLINNKITEQEITDLLK
jgi:hypothetical protein